MAEAVHGGFWEMGGIWVGGGKDGVVSGRGRVGAVGKRTSD